VVPFRCTLAPEPGPLPGLRASDGRALLAEVEGWPGELGAPGAPALALTRPQAAALRNPFRSRQFWQRPLRRLRRWAGLLRCRRRWREGLLPCRVGCRLDGGHCNQVSSHYASQRRLTGLGTEAIPGVPELILERQAQG